MVGKGEFRYTYSYSVDSALEYRENYVCLLCDLNDGYSLTFVNKEEMLQHLKEHIKAGHEVSNEELYKYRTP